MAEKEYIEREKAIAVIYGQHVGGKDACENARPNTYGADLREIVADIEDIPAADVEEVRHGQWRDDADEIDKRFHRHDFFCKKCNTRADYFIGGEGNWWSSYAPNFCPNCGAKMDGGVKDGT